MIYRPLVDLNLNCVCAVHDKSYVLRFKRNGSGKLRFVESVKAVGGGSGVSPAQFDVPMDQLDYSSLPCAWCGDGSVNYCRADCGALVCGGRKIGEMFICRKSCGAFWFGVPLKEVPMSEGAPKPRQSLPVTTKMLAAPKKG